MKPSEKHDESPKIVVMNITPDNVPNTIKNLIHGVKASTAAASVAAKLERGDVCIIRQVSQESRYKNGATRLWYYYDKEDVEGKTNPSWRPSTGWKYKLFMKPLVKQFVEPFFEEFSAVAGQEKIKKSLKVDGLLLTDIQGDVQGAITIDFRESELPKRYLKAIIEEKKEECNVQVDYENIDGNKTKVNLYEFLTDLIGDISYVKPDRGEQSRRAPGPATRQRRVQKRPTIDYDIEIDEAQKIEKTNAGLAFCPNCGTMLRPMPGKSGIPVYFCKECNKGFRINSK